LVALFPDHTELRVETGGYSLLDLNLGHLALILVLVTYERECYIGNYIKIDFDYFNDVQLRLIYLQN